MAYNPPLNHIKPGDVLAGRHDRSWRRDVPTITHRLFQVVRTTPTQAAVVHFGDGNPMRGEMKVRLSDGKVVGEDYAYLWEATPAMISQHEAEVAYLKRWRVATEALQDLVDKPLHQLNLSTFQLEALAAAWGTIKKMHPPVTPAP